MSLFENVGLLSQGQKTGRNNVGKLLLLTSLVNPPKNP
jgi:hypothetical protein